MTMVWYFPVIIIKQVPKFERKETSRGERAHTDSTTREQEIESAAAAPVQTEGGASPPPSQATDGRAPRDQTSVTSRWPQSIPPRRPSSLLLQIVPAGRGGEAQNRKRHQPTTDSERASASRAFFFSRWRSRSRG